ncbi:MAG: hypothetical protein V1826_00330 [bacterium]
MRHALFALIGLLLTAVFSAPAFALDKGVKALVADQTGQVCVDYAVCCSTWGQATYSYKYDLGGCERPDWSGVWLTDYNLVKDAKLITVDGHPAGLIAFGDPSGCGDTWAALLTPSYVPTRCCYDSCPRPCGGSCAHEVEVPPAEFGRLPYCQGSGFYPNTWRCGNFVKFDVVCVEPGHFITTTDMECGVVGAGARTNCGGLIGVAACSWSCSHCDHINRRTGFVATNKDEIMAALDDWYFGS